MRRREIDRRTTQLLERIDGDLDELRGAIAEIDHRTADALHAGHAIEAQARELAVTLVALRETVLDLERDRNNDTTGEHIDSLRDRVNSLERTVRSLSDQHP